MKNRLFLRTDASRKNGIGHLMRCLSLAQKWRRTGGEALFIGYFETDAVRKRIEKEGFEYELIQNPYPEPEDKRQTVKILYHQRLSSRAAPDHQWVVIDGYHFGPEYQQGIRESGYRVLVIDDTAHLPAYHADILLNQNLNADTLNYRCDSDTTRLLGARFVLLRQEFLLQTPSDKPVPARAKNLLVTFGGADSRNMTVKAIGALNRLPHQDFLANIVVGSENVNMDSIRKRLETVSFRHAFFKNADNMEKLMGEADAAIHGIGGTCWELAYMGVPGIGIVTADNQQKVAEMLARIGVIRFPGRWDEIDESALSREIAQLIGDESLRRNASARARNLIDGRGSERVCSEMLNFPR